MSDPTLPEDESVTATGGLKAGHLIVLAVLAVGLGIAAIFWVRGTDQRESTLPPPETVIEVPEGSRAVTLYFADKSNPVLVPETRLVAIGEEFVEQVAQVVRALLRGPEGEAVSTITVGTRLLDAFYDSETSTLYLDFSSEIVAGHPGGSSAEIYMIRAIMRSVSDNFPEVQAIQFLIEGLQVSTIAGHVDAYKPFIVSDWR